MKMWHMHDRTTPEQAEINRAKINNGKIFSMENTPETDDVINDGDELSSGSVVYGSRCRCNDSTGCVCIDGCRCNDGGVCCMDGARE